MRSLLILLFIGLTQIAFGQGTGDIEAVEIEILIDREIILPQASRQYDKIPPAPIQPVSPPIVYDFKPFNFRAPQFKPMLKPLKLKASEPGEVFKGYVKAGYGNYGSPLLEAYYNSGKDKNKLLIAQLFHTSSSRGPIDKSNSGNGLSRLNLSGRTFSQDISLAGELDFENRSTHFYGYGNDPVPDDNLLGQSYSRFRIGGEISNSKNSDFRFSTNARFSYLTDKFEARESAFEAGVKSTYKIKDESVIHIDGSFVSLSRKDVAVDAQPRSLFQVSGRFHFIPLDDMKITVGAVIGMENDTIDSRNIHIYPDVRVTYPITPSLDFIATLSGGLEKVGLETLSQENIWIGNNIELHHTNKSIDLGLMVNARIGNKMAAHAGLGLTNRKNWYFFQNREGAQNTFDVVYDNGNVKSTNLFGAISYTQNEKTRFMLRGDLYQYDTDEIETAWHRPGSKITANAAFNVVDKIYINLDMYMFSGSKAYDWTNSKTVELKPAFDLSARGEYRFSPAFSVFIQSHNLTGNTNPVFLRYPVRGLQVIGGFTWKF